MTYILAIDQGTSSTRAILYDLNGQVCQSQQYPITQHYPQQGWVEHDPEEIWQKTVTALQSMITSIDPILILACGITNQRETTLIWDKETGQCLAPAIVWQDRRTAAFCLSLEKHARLIQEKTGLRPDPYFSASKLHWLLNHVPNARRYAEEGRLAFGTIDSFLIWRLTGGLVHATDVTNASRTLLFNIHEETWDKQLLDLFDIPHAILPKVHANDAYFGLIRHDLVNASIPITGVIGDQQAALIGQGCLSPGMTKATYGTGGFLMQNTGTKPVTSTHQLLTTIAYKIKNETVYALEGSLYQAGTTVQWLRDELQLIQSADETETLAASLQSNEGVYFIPSYTGLGAPHWLSNQGAIITGLSRQSNRAHMARAALECVCYQTRDILNCMQQDSHIKLTVLRVDGGMTINQWFLQFLASLCQVSVQVPSSIETTALGAAMLAALGYGAIEGIESIHMPGHFTNQLVPEDNGSFMEIHYEGWLNAIRMLKNT